MFTRNFQKFINMKYVMYQSGSTSTSPISGATGLELQYMKDPNGDIYQWSSAEASFAFPSSSIVELTKFGKYTTAPGVNRLCQIGFGSGANEESFEDYTLSIIKTLTLSSSNASHVIDNINNVCHHTIKGIVQATAPCTINELGLFEYLETYYKNGGTEYRPFLFYRKKLDAPIILDIDEAASFNIDIDCPIINISTT